MTITRLKAKNQLTLPAVVLKRMGLKSDDLFAVDVEGNYIKLTPVHVEPRYTDEELALMDRAVDAQKKKGTLCRTSSEAMAHFKKIAKI